MAPHISYLLAHCWAGPAHSPELANSTQGRGCDTGQLCFLHNRHPWTEHGLCAKSATSRKDQCPMPGETTEIHREHHQPQSLQGDEQYGHWHLVLVHRDCALGNRSLNSRHSYYLMPVHSSAPQRKPPAPFQPSGGTQSIAMAKPST